jgi:pimeloyl-ACP methyl ester carboxylesterase/DNA-binding CsgD family transcriptional regulator
MVPSTLTFWWLDCNPASMPETQYAKSGDVHIAYQVVGNGPIDIVYVGSFFTHLEILWEHPDYRAFCGELASYCRLILLDKRGMGLSDPVPAGTIGERMEDVRAVLDAAGSDRAVVFGASEGGALAILFAVTYPERTRALVLWASDVCERRSDDWPHGDATEEDFEASVATISDWWATGEAIALMAPSLLGDPDQVRWAGRLFRHSASPGAAEAHLRVAFAIDVRHLLSAIAVPTLVAHRVGDESTRVGGSRFLAGQIPGANYAELPGVDHWVWLHADDFLAILRPFIDRIVGSRGFTEHATGSPAPWMEGSDVLVADLARDALARARDAAGEGRRELADAEARHALAVALRIRATVEADEAAAFLRGLDLRVDARAATVGKRLTTREIQILRHIARGLSTQRIAEIEVISPHTVHRHVANILNKLDVATRASAVAEGSRLGLL